jgi:hypothetical protein
VQKIIQDFYSQISWGDECQIEFIGNIEIVISSQVLYTPCDWIEAENLAMFAINSAKTKGLEPGMIIAGNPSKAIAERLCLSLTKQGILLNFVDAVAKVAQSQFICSALDGIDWGQTIKSIKEGRATPIWSWDE